MSGTGIGEELLWFGSFSFTTAGLERLSVRPWIFLFGKKKRLSNVGVTKKYLSQALEDQINDKKQKRIH